MLRTTLMLIVSLLALSAVSTAQARRGAHERGVSRAHAAHRVHGLAATHYRVPRQSGLRRGYRSHRHATPHRHFRPVVHAYRTVYERVWVPGYWEDVSVPPRYETRYDSCGRPYTVLVAAGYCKRVWHPGYYKRVARRVLADC